MTGTRKQTVVIKANLHRTFMQPRSHRNSSLAHPAPRLRSLGPWLVRGVGGGGVACEVLRAAPSHGTKQGRHGKFHNFKISC